MYIDIDIQSPSVKKLAALFVQKNGIYSMLEFVDIWDESRDARHYDEDLPVIAHPPCARWCKMAQLVQRVYGYKVGDDGGCFESALASVRRCGGVLEHPAWTQAWSRYGLPIPECRGWSKTFCGGWVCQVFQIQYGHEARKPTWLYISGIDDPPPLLWGEGESIPTGIIGGKTPFVRDTGLRRLGRDAASATPERFRDTLVELALMVKR